jgi:hypothetical protein
MAVRMDRASILVGVWRVESARRAEEKDGVVVLSVIAFWTFVVKIRDDADVDVDADGSEGGAALGSYTLVSFVCEVREVLVKPAGNDGGGGSIIMCNCDLKVYSTSE